MRHAHRAFTIKKPLRLAWVFGACVLFAGSAWPQSLWQKTAYGMSMREVVAAVPGIELITSSRPSVLFGGAIERMRLSEIRIAGYRFAGRFYFKDEKLEQVTLELRDARDWKSVLRAYEDVRQALAAKYGKQVQTGRDAENSVATWARGKTNITLAAIGSPPSTLNIVYHVPVPADSGNL